MLIINSIRSFRQCWIQCDFPNGHHGCMLSLSLYGIIQSYFSDSIWMDVHVLFKITALQSSPVLRYFFKHSNIVKIQIRTYVQSHKNQNLFHKSTTDLMAEKYALHLQSVHIISSQRHVKDIIIHYAPTMLMKFNLYFLLSRSTPIIYTNAKFQRLTCRSSGHVFQPKMKMAWWRH